MDIDFKKIIDEASVQALRTFSEKNTPVADIQSLPDDEKDLILTYIPVIKYIDRLVEESFRLYHQQSSPK